MWALRLTIHQLRIRGYVPTSATDSGECLAAKERDSFRTVEWRMAGVPTNARARAAASVDDCHVCDDSILAIYLADLVNRYKSYCGSATAEYFNWQVVVPLLAMKQEYLMHGILAMSVRHNLEHRYSLSISADTTGICRL